MKAPEMLWSPSKGLLIKERGWWYRLTWPNGAWSIGHEAVNELPDDVQTVWVVEEDWMRQALETQLNGEGGNHPTASGSH